MVFRSFDKPLFVLILSFIFTIPTQAGFINLVCKVNQGYTVGPWCTSLEKGDEKTTFRPKIIIQFNLNGQDQTKTYSRSIGGHNPLVYVWNSPCDGNNYYETPPGGSYKQGDSFHVKFTRQTLILCDISDIPQGAKINSIAFKAYVHPGEGGGSDGTIGIMQCTKIWEKDKINTKRGLSNDRNTICFLLLFHLL